jgi:ABC-type sugar transport system permease subunit
MAVTSSATQQQPAKRFFKGEWLTGYLFILPAVVVIFLFGLFPIGYALYMSLFRWRVRQGSFIGFSHYQNVLGNLWGALLFLAGLLGFIVVHRLWTARRKHRRRLAPVTLVLTFSGLIVGWNLMMGTGDGDFLASLVRTLFYAFLSIPVQIALSLGLAYLLYQNIKGREFFRMIFFLPYITPVVASAIVFRAIFSQREEALANQVVGWFGIAPQRWLFEPRPLLELLFSNQITSLNTWLTNTGASFQLEGLWLGPSLSLIVLILYGIWTFTGYNVVIFLAGLGNIPRQLYEAADLDGANGVQKFWTITVPLLSPVTFYLTLLGFIGALQAFTQLYVMRQPSARDSLDTSSLIIFDTFYKSNNFSLAATQSILLFVFILAITLIQNRVLKGQDNDG